MPSITRHQGPGSTEGTVSAVSTREKSLFGVKSGESPGMSNYAASGRTTVDFGSGSLSAFRTAAIEDVVTFTTRAPMPTMRADAPAIAVTRKNIRRSTPDEAVAVVGAAVQRRRRVTK